MENWFLGSRWSLQWELLQANYCVVGEKKKKKGILCKEKAEQWQVWLHCSDDSEGQFWGESHFKEHAGSSFCPDLQPLKNIVHSNTYQNPPSFAFLRIPTTCLFQFSYRRSILLPHPSHPVLTSIFSFPSHSKPYECQPTLSLVSKTWLGESFFPSPFLPIILMHLLYNSGLYSQNPEAERPSKIGEIKWYEVSSLQKVCQPPQMKTFCPIM